MEKELKVLQHYNLITATDANETRKQYDKLYFKDGYAFIKEDILNQAQQKVNQQQIYQEPPSNPYANPNTNQNPPPFSNEHERSKKFSLDESDLEDDLTSLIQDRPQKTTLPPGSIGISVSTIRQITGYSYNVKMPWHTSPVRVPWQQELIDSQANIIVVDGSRQ